MKFSYFKNLKITANHLGVNNSSISVAGFVIGIYQPDCERYRKDNILQHRYKLKNEITDISKSETFVHDVITIYEDVYTDRDLFTLRAKKILIYSLTRVICYLFGQPPALEGPKGNLCRDVCLQCRGVNLMCCRL